MSCQPSQAKHDGRAAPSWYEYEYEYLDARAGTNHLLFVGFLLALLAIRTYYCSCELLYATCIKILKSHCIIIIAASLLNDSL